MNSGVKNSQTYDPASNLDDDEVDLGDLIGVLLDNKWLITAIMSFVLACGVAYAFIATPIYKADGLIQVEEKSSGLGDIDLAELFEGDTSVNAEIEILRSRLVLGTVIENLKLDINAEPDYFPIIGAALARHKKPEDRKSIRAESLDLPQSLIGQPLTLVVKSGDRYELVGPEDESLLIGTVGEPAVGEALGEPISIFVSVLNAETGDTFSVSRQARLKAIDQLKNQLSISEKGKGSGILTVSFEGDSATKVSRTLNEIANVYVRKNVERKSAEAEKTLEFLDEQLPIVKQEMEAAEVALNSYRLEKGSIDLPLETQAVLETIVTVEGQLNEIRRERDRALQSFTTVHPMVVALDRQIASLNAELSKLNDQVRELPSTQQEVLRLVRDTQVNTELYTSLLNLAQELRVVKAGTVGNVRVVDNAVVPYKSIKPDKVLVLIISLVLGSLIGLAAAFIRKALSSGVEDPEIIEKHLNMPVYATVVHSKRQDRLYDMIKSKEKKNAVLATDSPNDTAVESLRNLRTALHFGMMDANNNCVMIAGPSPHVGKSFISVNLAAVLTSNDKKVLLIDGDMRRGHLHEYLGLERENGLSEFTSGVIPIGEALHQTALENLTLMPTGKIPPNPAELLLHQRFSNCISVLSPRYDHIIIDSPPVLAVTDASIIGQAAGATMMVLRAGAHPLREIEIATRRLRQAGVNLRGVVLNGTKLENRRYGAKKYTYQYSYEK